jgi:hypothetical protein
VELQGRIPELTAQGLTVVGVSYDPVETLAAFSRARKITFPLLSDTGSTIIRQYGLFNETIPANTRAYGVPYPGTFVLDPARKVTARYFEEEYQERNTAASIIVRQGGAGRGPTVTAANAHLSMKATISDDTVAPGSRVTVAIDITPARNIHVYAPGADYQVIALTLDPDPLLVTHPVQYPKSERYHFKPLNETVPVFQKPFRLTQDVTIAATREAQKTLAGRKTLALSGKLDYQACDDSICFRPASIPFTFELKVKPLDRPQ